MQLHVYYCHYLDFVSQSIFYMLSIIACFYFSQLASAWIQNGCCRFFLDILIPIFLMRRRNLDYLPTFKLHILVVKVN